MKSDPHACQAVGSPSSCDFTPLMLSTWLFLSHWYNSGNSQGMWLVPRSHWCQPIVRYKSVCGCAFFSLSVLTFPFTLTPASEGTAAVVACGVANSITHRHRQSLHSHPNECRAHSTTSQPRPGGSRVVSSPQFHDLWFIVHFIKGFIRLRDVKWVRPTCTKGSVYLAVFVAFTNKEIASAWKIKMISRADVPSVARLIRSCRNQQQKLSATVE